MANTNQIRDVSALSPLAQTAFRLFRERCQAAGLDFIVTETYRSQERQTYLYEQGRTRPGKIVTWTKHSRHTSRRAWDIVKRNPNGSIDYSDKAFYQKCGKIAAELNITWGGTWKQADTPHFEIKENWKPPKEDNAMTESERKEFEQLKATVNQLAAQQERVYHYTTELPEYPDGTGRATIQKLLDRGIYKGAAPDDLNLPETLFRLLVLNDRAGVYK